MKLTDMKTYRTNNGREQENTTYADANKRKN